MSPTNEFESTAPYYGPYRPGVPEQAARLLAQRANGKPDRILLDLGSGTGQVPLALAEQVTQIDVVERDKGMITEAGRALASLPVTVRLHNVAAEDFAPPTSTWEADLVTVCRAFHWMDQPLVLSRLDACTAPDATIAVMGDGSLWNAKEAWSQDLRSLIQKYLGTERRAGKDKTFKAHNRPYREVLADSPFSQVEEHDIAIAREWTPDRVVGYLWSTSFAGRELFGDRLDDFERHARALLAEHAADGVLTEHAVFQVVLGRRG
ncbi:class I SAM-dependent methyltransferase [Streptomyces sp. NPDC054835]|uniref:class I SAM-dependent methyltransferase n=1 Tax=Streptomyces exfoliatus TaxID=1905 RepID=UPI0004657510|nr:class I SAM-dependent methyltransferase [Streptomyces exfoliatus]